MNSVLASYYGTGDAAAKQSSAGSPLRTLHHARRVVEHLDARGVSVLKASESDLADLWKADPCDEHGSVTELGGPTDALQKVSSMLGRVRAWQGGEADGRVIARHGLKAALGANH